ncbi:hypothetical protein [Persicobacter diffluens]|uniref:Outer membrane protein beta-barrel domain-containing protein n=1 Tax=Persicobacter diffluens TaxID=981 RepID=A0AAN5AKI5_9BACT|nr:hypothetical protein PEDI_27060 [Persicobacter diffluens]
MMKNIILLATALVISTIAHAQTSVSMGLSSIVPMNSEAPSGYGYNVGVSHWADAPWSKNKKSEEVSYVDEDLPYAPLPQEQRSYRPGAKIGFQAFYQSQNVGPYHSSLVMAGPQIAMPLNDKWFFQGEFLVGNVNHSGAPMAVRPDISNGHVNYGNQNNNLAYSVNTAFTYKPNEKTSITFGISASKNVMPAYGYGGMGGFGMNPYYGGMRPGFGYNPFYGPRF